MVKNLLLWKKGFMLSLMFLTSIVAYSQTATAPSVGDGSEDSPYEISTLENLYWLTQSDTAWDNHFIQTADIDATATVGWDSGAGFSPIGNSTVNFTGSYNGNGHIINSLYIDRSSTDFIALFGLIDNSQTIIDSLGVTNINFTGNTNIGAIVGYLKEGSISNSFSTGEITSESNQTWALAGGFVGNNYYGIINQCYSHVNINAGGLSTVGGFAGKNRSTITNCYSTGNVIGNSEKGGFIGRDISGNINNCFWDTETSGLTYSAKGTGLTTTEMKNVANYLNATWDFMDETYNGTDDIWGINSTDNNAYPFLQWQGFSNDALACQAPISTPSDLLFGAMQVTSIEVDSIIKTGYNIDGYVVYINSTDTWVVPTDGTAPATNTEWQNTGQQCIYVGTSQKPSITVTALTANTQYYFKVYGYNDCSGTEMYEDTGDSFKYTTAPVNTEPNGTGAQSNPYQISNIENLAWLMINNSAWDKYFIQTADIDATTTTSWGNGAGFIPIGNLTTNFTGSYNGEGYIINGLHINKPTTDNIGLFGLIDNPQTKIDSLGVTNVDFTGNTNIGAIVGYLREGAISNTYSTGECTSESSQSWAQAGGFVGNNYYGIISQCYTHVNVNAVGLISAGGFVGPNRGTITNCYSTGNVIGTSYTGGFVGNNYNYTTNGITNCFWDTETSGQADSEGGIGLTTAEMKKAINFLQQGWDFYNESTNGTNDYWGINGSDNNGYPFLMWQGYEQTCAPLGQASNIILTDIQTNGLTIESFTEAGYGGADGYVVYISDTNNIVAPENGANPTTNIVWQNSGAQCVYNGVSINTNVNITDLALNDEYFIKVFAYNNCSGSKVYETNGASISTYTQITNTIPTGDGSLSTPYQITNLENLAWLMYNEPAWNKHFIQTSDIDATTTTSWGNSAGFIPIGNSTTNFTGSYNGKGHIIDSLYIDRPSTDNIGLFGLIDNPQTKIDSLGVTNVDIKGNTNIGAIVGYLREGAVSNTYSTGECTSESSQSWAQAGGFVGNNHYGIINQCYSHVNVNAPGLTVVGGFVGKNKYTGTITNCYSTGKVIGTSYKGGFIGDYDGGNINYCFWDTETSGLTYSTAGTGLTTTEMKNVANYLNATWDFMDETYNGTDDIWGINSTDNNAYPFLSWEGFTCDNFCDAPYSPANNIVFSNSLASSITLESFTEAGYGTAGYAIFINTTDTWTDPADGDEPTINTTWQNTGQQCIYLGESNNPNTLIEGLDLCTGGSDYYIKVYAYNTCSDSKVYETTGVVETIVATDNIAPVADVETLTDVVGQCSVTVTDTPTATDACVGSITGTTINPLEYNVQGTYTITWTYDDGNGNTSTQEQTVIVNDDTAPVANATSLNDATGQCSVTVSETPTATDNCSGAITGTTTNPLEYAEQGTYTITWTYTDDEGNISTQNQTVIVDDDIAPIADATSLNNATGQCSVTVSETPTATDNCEGSITGTTTDPLEYTEQGTHTITWTYDDGNGNTSTQNQTVIVNDDTAPVVDVTTLVDVTGQCSVAVSETPTATDNCSGTITATTTDPLTYTEQGAYTITWTYDDENGNISTQEQTVVVNDDTDPTITCVDNQNKEISATATEYTVSGTEFDPVSTDDNCEVASVENDFNNTTTIDGAEFPTGTTTVTWTVTDLAGNTAECSFDVTVSQSTGISSLGKLGVSIYPNPVTGILNITNENGNIERITILDITGKTIIDKTGISETEQIDMSEFNTGIYLIRIDNGENVNTSKIIKK